MIHRLILLSSYFLLFLFWGCRSCNEPPPPEHTVLSGSATLLVSESYADLLTKESSLFSELYPKALLTVHATSTEEAIVHFLNDSVQMICIERHLNEEEQELITQYSIPLGSTVFAYDGLAIVVHQLNPIQRISRSSLASIVTGKATKWQQVPESQWSGSILLAVTHKHSGVYQLLRTTFFRTSSELPLAVLLSTQKQVINYISKHPQSIGIVPFSTVQSLFPIPDLKILPVEVSIPDSGIRYLKPSQENIFQNLYPFRYSLYLYTRETKGGLGLGFGSFLLTYPGQKLIQDFGIAPVKIPSRPIQLTAE